MLTVARTDTPMLPPQGVTVSSPAAGQATITWTANPEGDRDGYCVYYTKTAGSPLTNVTKFLCPGGAAAVSCAITGLNSTDTYYFYVTAFDTEVLSAPTYGPGVVSVDFSTDLITLSTHGYTTGVRGTFTGTTLPGGINMGED